MRYNNLIRTEQVIKIMEEFATKAAGLENKKCNMQPILNRNFAADVIGYSKSDKFFTIFFNFNTFACRANKMFNNYIYVRYPSARGFASITLTILHEIGHFHTFWDDYGYYNREKELEMLKAHIKGDILNYTYFNLPDERAATDWAIRWLQDPEHRKMAKAFEKEFFKCFKK